MKIYRSSSGNIAVDILTGIPLCLAVVWATLRLFWWATLLLGPGWARQSQPPGPVFWRAILPFLAALVLLFAVNKTMAATQNDLRPSPTVDTLTGIPLALAFVWSFLRLLLPVWNVGLWQPRGGIYLRIGFVLLPATVFRVAVIRATATTAAEAGSQRPPEAGTAASRFCGSCGVPVVSSGRFCMSCGSPTGDR